VKQILCTKLVKYRDKNTSVMFLNFYNRGFSAEYIITYSGGRVDEMRKNSIWHEVVVCVWKALVETEGNRVPADGLSMSLAR